jgi:hypothetical protein
MTSPTIEQFYKITKLRIANELSPIDLDIESCKIMHPELTEDEIDDLTLEEFRKLNDIEWVNVAIPLESFALAGVIWNYRRKVGTSGYSITLKQMQRISEAMTKNNIEYVHHVLDALYEPSSPVIGKLEVLRHAELAWAMPFIYQIKASVGA